MADIDLNVELGPQFTIEVAHSMGGAGVAVNTPFVLGVAAPVEQTFTIVAGVKSSSLFSGGGNPGNPDFNLNMQIAANANLSLYRAVTLTGIYCQPTVEGLSQYAGVTLSAIALATTGKIAKSGLISEGSWTWTVDAPIFIGVDGVLTQTAGSLPMRRIGWATSATQINLDPYPMIGD